MLKASNCGCAGVYGGASAKRAAARGTEGGAKNSSPEFTEGCDFAVT